MTEQKRGELIQLPLRISELYSRREDHDFIVDSITQNVEAGITSGKTIECFLSNEVWTGNSMMIEEEVQYMLGIYNKAAYKLGYQISWHTRKPVQQGLIIEMKLDKKRDIPKREIGRDKPNVIGRKETNVIFLSMISKKMLDRDMPPKTF